MPLSSCAAAAASQRGRWQAREHVTGERWLAIHFCRRSSSRARRSPPMVVPRLRAVRWSLVRVGLVARLLVLLLALATQTTRLGVQHRTKGGSEGGADMALAAHYDGSSQLWLESSLRACGASVGPVQRAWTESLSWLAHWDGVHFLDVAQRGGYDTEKETAFAPGWPALVHTGAKILQAGQISLTHRTHRRLLPRPIREREARGTLKPTLTYGI